MASVVSFYRLFEKDINRLGPAARSGRTAFRIEKAAPFSVRVAEMVLSAAGMEQFYFRDRRNRYEAGAIGCARAFTGEGAGRLPVREMACLWEQDPLFTLFGGMSFFDVDTPPEWQSFDRFRFVLPLVELRKDVDGCRVVLNCVIPPGKTPRETGDDILACLRRLDSMPKQSPLPDKIPPYTETLVPGPSDWNALVGEALAWLRENGSRKVVLARKKIMRSPVPWDPALLFQGIGRIEEDSFLFYCRRKSGDAFFGRTPERLFRKTNGFLLSEAIAGTRQRGYSPDQDTLLESELMASDKDMEEHQIVVDYIRRQMSALCTDLEVVSAMKPLKLRHLQHIVTRVRGRERNGQDPVETLFMFHPTPAVCGVPPEGSREMIQRLEPFGRGWYGAPIGWMSRHEAEFAVGIRSALVRETELHLFGGAGIMEKSDAELEWQETGHKMENFTRILQGEGQDGNG